MNKRNFETVTIGQLERNAIASKQLFQERLNFMNGKMLRNVDVTLEEGSVARKVRRIVEKRMCQFFFRQHRSNFRTGGNRNRHLMKRAVSYELYNLGQIEDPDIQRGYSTHWKKEYDEITGKIVLKKKMAYQTLQEAEEAAMKLRFLHMDDNPLYAYKCAYCHRYHIGHHVYRSRAIPNTIFA